MAKYEFNGMTTESYNQQDKEQFVEISDNLLIKKVPFTVELENKDIELYLYIEDTDMSEFENDNTNHIISIGVIPSFNSLSTDNQKTILEQFSEDEQERIKADTLALAYEGYLYGYQLSLRSETITEDTIDYKIKSAIATHTAVEGLIGFELDRCYNRIGNTGWDFLDDYCNDKDLLAMAMDRYNG